MTEENIGKVEVDIIEDAFKKTEPDVAEEEIVETAEDVEHEDGDSEGDDQPFPKKAENAISRHKKKANKYKAERDAYAREIAELKKQQEAYKSAEKPSEPKLDDFESISEYMKAQARFETQNALSEHTSQQAESKLQTLEAKQREVYEEERSEHILQKAQELFEVTPEAKEVFAQVLPIVENLPPEVAQIAQELDNAPLAIYNLYKEGKLEQLANVSPYVAAAMLYQAQLQQPQATQRVSQAPKPISAAKGSGASKTSLNSMSPDKLMEWALS